MVVPLPLRSPSPSPSPSSLCFIYISRASSLSSSKSHISNSLAMASPSSSIAVLLLLLFLHSSFTHCSSSAEATASSSKAQKAKFFIRRTVDEGDGGERAQNPAAPKKNTILGAKNQTKLLRPKKANSTAAAAAAAAASAKVKLGKSFNATIKASNSTKLLDAVKLRKANSTKSSKDKLKSPNSSSNSTKSSKKSGFDSSVKVPKAEQPTKEAPAKKPPTVNEKVKTAAKTEELAAGMEMEDDLDDGTDLVSDFRELPSRLFPDLERLSTTSKAYISAANKGIAEGVKPYVGKSFAPKVAPVLSSLFMVPPLLLLFLLFRRLRAYLSLHRLLLFTQAYLAIYFGTLALTALATGLEPLRFFYATSPACYAWMQAAQTMGYLIYLVLQLSDLVSLFSGCKDSPATSSRALALAQMVIGLAVGIHYYAAVFHRAVCGEPPRVNWRVHGIYATCFLAICTCARADRRKKAYCDCEGGEDGKKN